MESRSAGRKRGEVLRDQSITTPPKQPRAANRERTPTRSTKSALDKTTQLMEDVRFSSDDNMPVVRKKGGQDNRENHLPAFANEINMEETVSLSAIENYFLKGKMVQQNKKRRRGGKRGKRGERPDAADDDEDEEEEEEMEGEKGDGRYAECDLNELREYHKREQKSEAKVVEQLGSVHFNKWTLYLASGFNVMVHGLGSLRPLLHAYAQHLGQQYTVVEVEAFRPETTPRSVLTTIYDLLKLKFQKRRSVTEWARQMAEEVTDRDVILVIHNIDDPPFRAESDMEVLSILAAAPHFHLIASAQHNNRMLLWNTRSIAPFNWVHNHIDTWFTMREEIFTGSSSLLGLSSATSAANHTMSSLEVLWQSLNENARSIFHAFFSLVYGTQPESEAKSVSFFDLFYVAKDNFWVSSDAALRQQLVEFCDHRLIRMRRGNDGNERIYPSADRSIIDRFLKGVEMPLEEMQVGDGEEEEE